MTGFTSLPDLAVRTLGGSVVAASDESFAEKENLLNPWEPAFRPETFGPKGQLYDGWETARRRTPGHDWALIRLGLPGQIHGIVIDTAWFKGNYPPHASVEACFAEGYPAPAELEAADWTEIVPKTSLKGDTAHTRPTTESERVFTHVRLNMFPDGGIARLRVHGRAVPNPAYLTGLTVDLAALENGARVLDCSDRFYSSPDNMLFPGLARTQAEGWETARRRDTGNDWAEIALAAPGTIELAELDTTNLKFNAPAEARLTATTPQGDHTVILQRTRLQPDTRHRYRLKTPEVAKVRLDIYPDGGLARLRLWGPLKPEVEQALTTHWNTHTRQ
ncbi:allantoicase [Actinomadura coerulea]|uniref:Probable allantoicase n=1 Tax=Actinomadura coerulea TaxID=46159 RepID=A0A7X0L3V4_9ACTN|nr:allantoicase [Actinomadura coerulea]MBB6400669.1 allantoicase [Actinomadura coerulea]GGQ08925.1 putative allantoicase [Actinomadura coerulea]